jgi:hypothetical protein
VEHLRILVWPRLWQLRGCPFTREADRETGAREGDPPVALASARCLDRAQRRRGRSRVRPRIIIARAQHTRASSFRHAARRHTTRHTMIRERVYHGRMRGKGTLQANAVLSERPGSCPYPCVALKRSQIHPQRRGRPAARRHPSPTSGRRSPLRPSGAAQDDGAAPLARAALPGNAEAHRRGAMRRRCDGTGFAWADGSAEDFFNWSAGAPRAAAPPRASNLVHSSTRAVAPGARASTGRAVTRRARRTFISGHAAAGALHAGESGVRSGDGAAAGQASRTTAATAAATTARARARTACRCTSASPASSGAARASRGRRRRLRAPPSPRT